MHGLQAAEHAAVLYQQLQPFGGRSAPMGIPVCAGPTDMALAQLAALLGDAASATSHFTSALAFADPMQAPTWRAWALYRT